MPNIVSRAGASQGPSGLESPTGTTFSTGAACHSGQDTESHVMRAIGMSKAAAREVVRISVGPHTTNDEIDAAMRILCEEAEMLLDLAPSPRGARLRTGHDSHG